jgi:hypothetical protein
LLGKKFWFSVVEPMIPLLMERMTLMKEKQKSPQALPTFRVARWHIFIPKIQIFG